MLQRTVNPGFQCRGVRQIGHADGAAAHFVLVARPDAAASGANLGALARRFFASAVKFAVERQDQRRVFRDHQVLGVDLNTLPFDRLNFFQQMPIG